MHDSSFLKPDEYVYGFVVVCKPLNHIERVVYSLTNPNATTITVTGLAGGTEYKVQVVALVAERNTKTSSIYGSVIFKTATNKGGKKILRLKILCQNASLIKDEIEHSDSKLSFAVVVSWE
jgi:hypothetical protein